MIIQEKIYPINGTWRLLLLYEEWIIIFLLFELSLILWLRTRKSKKSLGKLQDIAFAYLLCGYGSYHVFIIYADFYVTQQFIRSLLIFLASLVNMLFIFSFYYNMERFHKFFKKFLFSIIHSIVLITFILSSIFNLELLNLISFRIYNFIIFIFLLICILKIIILNRNKKDLRKQYGLFVFLALFALMMFGLGFPLTFEQLIQIYGMGSRFIGNLCQIIALLSLFLAFNATGLLSVTGSKEGLEKLFIMMRSGLGIYGKDFRKQKMLDFYLITGVLRNIQYALDTITDKTGISIIEKEDEKLILLPYKSIVGVLIVNTNHKIYEVLLLELLHKIYSYYGEIIENWDHNLKPFDHIDDLVKEYFQ